MYGPYKVACLMAILLACLLVQRAKANLARCMETHKDRPCQVSGDLPVRLRCRVGKWFRIKRILNDSLVDVDPAAMETAKKQCKNSRARNSRSGYYECAITSLGGPKQVQRVVVQYMCWELDPDVLAGFGPLDGFNLR